MNKIQEKRLLKVAKALRKSKQPQKFAMDKFVWGEMDRLPMGADREQELNFCGTPACALGHYAARKDQRFLKIVVDQPYVDNETPVASVKYFRNGDRISYVDERIQEYFGIDYVETELLFGPEGCGEATDAIEAAKYIEQFVKDKRRERKLQR